MTVMAKKKPKTEEQGRDKGWGVFARLDPALKKPTEDYIKSREYPPHLARVLERALRMLLEQEGYWPPS
jgi:hypothetical protein